MLPRLAVRSLCDAIARARARILGSVFHSGAFDDYVFCDGAFDDALLPDGGVHGGSTASTGIRARRRAARRRRPRDTHVVMLELP